MSYVVLARKWRPQQLVDVLGQEHVTRTLRNAFASGRIAQTFLFTGPRGVGKTSAARILAKALCCESSDGPTPEPCGVCRQCRAIAEGTSTDVIEIDAASHTGVDNVRDVIIDAVRYLPSSARFKVYIIDEVHMLSSSSFNALLKTFEEPPPHVKFVLATTDPHKVPVTILSRCQRYDFRLIASARMQSRLSEILLAEEVDHDPSALALVARIADGSMRDAQSLLEQVLAFAGERRIDGDIVREALGAVDAALVERTIASIFESAPDAVFRSVAEVHERGLGHARFAGSLVEHVRDLVAARMVKDPSAVVDRPADEIASLVQFASQHAPERLERLFEALCRLQEEVARSLQPRYALEVGLASLAAQPAAVPVDALMGQLERVERALSGGGSGGPAPRRFSRPGGGGRPSAGRSPEHVSSAQHGGPRTHGRAPSRPRRGVGGDEPPAEPEPSAPTISAPPEPPLERPPPGNPADPPPLPSVGPNEPPLPEEPPPWLDDTGGSRGSEVATPRPPQAAKTFSPEEVEATYRRFVAQVARRRPALGASLHQVRPVAFAATGVRLACETAFDDDKLREPETRSALSEAIEGFFGARVPLEVTRARGPDDTEAPRTLNEVADEERAARVAAKEKTARERPAVRAVERELGASIARVRILGEDQGDHDR